MLIFKKIAEFFTGTKPVDASAPDPYKAKISASFDANTHTGISGARMNALIKANEVPIASAAPLPAPIMAKEKNATLPTPKVKVKKVETAPIVVAPKFNSVDLESKSKTELLDLAKQQGAKVNARMGKAAIIAKLVK